MAGVNSLLFLLTTLAPNTEPPDSYSTKPYSVWDIKSDNYDDNVLKPCRLERQPAVNIVCDTNEHYERCGAVCQEACVKYDCPLNCCVEGCFCDEGYVRSLNGTCLQREECIDTSYRVQANEIEGDDDDDPMERCFPFVQVSQDTRCSPNEHYESCGAICQEACVKYTCPLHCCVNGCFCNEGLVRDFNRTCIKKENCFVIPGHSERNRVKASDIPRPEECGPDEYIGCESQCQRNCSNYHDIIPCPRACVLGCVCTLPKIRGPDGDCILPQECPSRSLVQIDKGTDHVTMLCHLMRARFPEMPECPLTVKLSDDPDSCEAEERGYRIFQVILDDLEKFVQVDDVSKPCHPELKLNNMNLTETCPPGEHVEECAPICFDSCFYYNCNVKCCLPACQCDKGYSRGRNDECVPTDQCHENIATCQPKQNVDKGKKHDIMLCNLMRARFPEMRECPLTAKVCTNPHGCEDDEQFYRRFEIFIDELSKKTEVDDESEPCFPELKVREPWICPPGEHFEECGPICFDSCFDYNCTLKCCAPSCHCDEGYTRGRDFECVPKEQCPENIVSSQPKQNVGKGTKHDTMLCQLMRARFPEMRECPLTAKLYNDPDGCDDDEKWYRLIEAVFDDMSKRIDVDDESMPCVPDPYYSVSGNCPPREHFEECAPICFDSCFDYNCTLKCCVGVCHCDEGYTRGRNLECVPTEQCPEVIATCQPKQNVGKGTKHDTMLCHLLRARFPKMRDCPLTAKLCNDPDGCDDDEKWYRLIEVVLHDLSKEIEVDEEGKPCFPEQNVSADCPPGEHYEECTPICFDSCVDYKCPLKCCVKGCQCDEGYTRGRNFECVPTEQCPENIATSQPKQNVGKGTKHDTMLCHLMRVKFPEMRECPLTAMLCDDPYSCDDDEKFYKFIELFLDDISKHIEVDDVSKPCYPELKLNNMNLTETCPPGQHYEECAPICFDSCFDYKCPLKCCIKKCQCDEGYSRGRNFDCVPTEQCPENIAMSQPKQNVGKGTKHDTMLCHLMRTRFPKMRDCPLTAKLSNDTAGCVDNEKLYRMIEIILDDISKDVEVDEEGKPCFPEQNVSGPRDCPPGEHYEECTPICFDSCFDYVCPLKCCVNRCQCDEGYTRGRNLKCVLTEQCPENIATFQPNQNLDSISVGRLQPDEICGPDERVSCDTECERHCNNYDGERKLCPFRCRCLCNAPKIRGPDGDCILPEQCSLKKLEKDLTRSAVICNFVRIMENPPAWSNSCPVIVKQCSNPEDCSSNNMQYSLPNPQGQFLKCRKKNEFLNLCAHTCPDTCDDYKDRSKTCKKICLPVPKCDCKSGFVRGPTGECITPEECPDHGKGPDDCEEREYYDSCGTACEENCTTYIKTDKTCNEKRCVVGCFCNPGLIRGPDGQCIWPFECYLRVPQPVDSIHARRISEMAVCPENEEWQSCGTACPKNCTNYDKDIRCAQVCTEGCFCKEPRVRGPDGKCILVDDCPPRLRATSQVAPDCPNNEYYDECGTACPPNCANYDKPIPCPSACVEGCFCRSPLVRGPHGKCIEVTECSFTPRLPDGDEDKYETVIPDCEENEHFMYCGTLCPRNCSNYDRDIPCPLVCAPACYCRFPLVRGPDGKCIDAKDCPPRSEEDESSQYPVLSQFANCKENQEFTFCKSICPDTCNNYKEERFCKLICFPGCDCKPGYVISRSGVCIREEHCVEDRPEDCTQLEDFNECGSYCETDCFNYNLKYFDCNIEGCRKGCYCKPGWVRSPDMKCVRPFECPRISIKEMLEESDSTTESTRQSARESTKEALYFRSRM